ncbi:MAG: Rrf2 family transcriptional regulator [Pseudomonadota bacterium]
MSHISTGVEYALHCLLFLASASSGAREAGAKDLAELQGIPAEYVAKLFTKLSKAGLVNAVEGVRGGFSLALPAAEISVLDVIDAIDGDKRLFECREVRQRCAVLQDNPPDWSTVSPCSIQEVMLSAEARMREELARHTLADLAQRVDDKTPDSYGVAVVQWLGHRSSSRRAGRA